MTESNDIPGTPDGTSDIAPEATPEATPEVTSTPDPAYPPAAPVYPQAAPAYPPVAPAYPQAAPGYPAYPQAAPGYPAYPIATTSSNAVVALILAIVSWAVCPVIPAIVALVLAHSAAKEIAASGGRVQGGGLVTASRIVAWINIGLWAAVLIVGAFVLVLVAVAGGMDSARV
jgi:hypothetical protein